MISLSGLIAKRPNGRFTRTPHRLLFGRPFTEKSALRLVILFEQNRISYASVYPFLYYAENFAAKYDVEIRVLPVHLALSKGLPKGLANPTHVLAQTWLTDPPEKHAAMQRLLASLPGETVTAYLDTFANADIRLASVFTNVDMYFKKSLFVDPYQYLRLTFGHTNLTEYYGKLYGLADDMTDWNVPETALSKLRLAPNFLTDPNLMSAFLAPDESASQPSRDIDLHARLGGTGRDGWYGEMRRHASNTVDKFKDLRIVTGTGIGRRVFMEELHRSKICFSPFGFGEVCWRDVEAIAAGAVLIKPDMSHLRTEPELFRDGETYIACRWDFADLEDKVFDLLADDTRRRRIASTARGIAKRYLAEAGPVATFGALFSTHGEVTSWMS